VKERRKERSRPISAACHKEGEKEFFKGERRKKGVRPGGKEKKEASSTRPKG